MVCMHRCFGLFAAMALFLVAALAAPARAQPAPELIETLRAGGLVIYWRHPATHNDQTDTNPFNLADCSTQRQLNDTGRSQSRTLGAALRDRGIIVAAILSSPFCRAKEAAELLGLGAVTVVPELGEGGLVVSPNENGRRARALRTMLGTAPTAGNTLLVSHRPNILDAVGVDAFAIAEGEIFVFRPQAEAPGYGLLGRVPLAAWR
jgi:phosphohistidine phosphatase SixA